MDLEYDYNESYIISCIEYIDRWEIKSSFHLFTPVCCILIFCISILGNSFLLWVLLRERAWKTASDILLLQLTISNLCFTVVLPFEAYQLLHGWIFGYMACKVVRGVFFLGLNSYVLILTAMTRYNYVTVVHASRLSVQGSKKLYVIISSLIWLVCAAVSIDVSVNSQVSDYGFGPTLCIHAPPPHRVLFFNIYRQNILFFLIPFIIMLCCFVCMWIKQCGMRGQHQGSRLILGMVVVFFICLAPHNIRHLIMSLDLLGVLNIPFEWMQPLHDVDAIFYALLLSHCCLNPLFHVCRAQMSRRHHPRPYDILSQRGDGIQSSSMAVIPPRDTSV